MGELGIGQLDGAARRSEHDATTMSELVQAQAQLYHDMLRRGHDSAEDRMVVSGGTRHVLRFSTKILIDLSFLHDID